MKKHIMYYERMTGELLNRRKISIFDIVAACFCFAAGLFLFISKKSLPAAFIMFFAAILEIVNSLVGYCSGKCPACKNSFTVKPYMTNYVLYCEKCKSILYKRDRWIYKLKFEEDRKIRLIPYGIMTRGIILFFWIELIAYFILLALGLDKTVINKIDYVNFLPLAILVFTSFYNLIQKKRIEIKDSREESAK